MDEGEDAEEERKREHSGNLDTCQAALRTMFKRTSEAVGGVGTMEILENYPRLMFRLDFGFPS